MSSKQEASSFAEKIVQKGYQVLSFDLPKHGDRINNDCPFIVWDCVIDLGIIGEYVRQRWNDVSLYACSVGAYFSLLAYKDFMFRKCLFLSPILDMEQLIQKLLRLEGANVQMLKENLEIPTKIGETLYWDDYSYVIERPINEWDKPTAILYGSEDNLSDLEVVEGFVKRYACDLTVMEGGEHWFHTESQLVFLNKWLELQLFL